MAPGERDARRAALREKLERQGLDGLIITHLANLRYVTGFTGSAGIALVTRAETVLLTDFRYREQADAEAGDLARIEIVPQDLWARVWEVLREIPGIGAVGFEAATVTVQESERFTEAAARWRVEPTKDVVEGLRASKSPGEILAIRRAARVAADAFDATLSTLRPGLRELDVAATLESELRRRGSEWHPFPTIVASGPRSALPHARTSTRIIETGDWVLLDFGAQMDGYCADLTRTVVVGRAADDGQRTIYDLVRDAQLHARTDVRAGMIGRDADALARSMIDARGFGDAFGHSLGHGLGLEVHEAPRLSRYNDQPLPDHAVVTIEPGIYLPGWGGVRIEDDVHLDPAGAVLLSDGRTDLIEVR